MDSSAAAPAPTIPARGKVQRTFVEARVLAGFMDQPHLQGAIPDHLAELEQPQVEQFWKDHQAAQGVARNLPVVEFNDSIIRDCTGPYVTSLSAKPDLLASFRQRPFAFKWVRPEKLVALQVVVRPRNDKMPDNEDKLLEMFLPTAIEVPTEIQFTPPEGPIHLLSSVPQAMAIEAELDGKNGRLILKAPRHVNLTQVVHFQGRFYLKNGYHRVLDAIAAGLKEIPAIVVEAQQPDDVPLKLQNHEFGLAYTLGLKRPPLVRDFLEKAALPVQSRQRRFGVTIRLDISPLSVGV